MSADDRYERRQRHLQQIQIMGLSPFRDQIQLFINTCEMIVVPKDLKSLSYFYMDEFLAKAMDPKWMHLCY